MIRWRRDPLAIVSRETKLAPKKQKPFKRQLRRIRVSATMPSPGTFARRIG
jgi:hypothetical protein